MKNKLISSFAFLLIISALTSCTNKESSESKANADKAPEFVFTYAENQAKDYPTTQGAYKFAELVKEKTNGRIEIMVVEDGESGDEKSVIEQLQFGGIDFARVSLSPLSELVPKLNVLQMPYLYTGAEHMWKVLDGDIGDEFMASFDGSNMVALSWYDAGARNFYNSKRPVTSLEDIKGLKIRVQESELMINMIEALGAKPVPMAYSEVYSSLQTGAIDGAENNLPSYESTKHYEAAKYYTIDEHSRVPELQLAAKAVWDKLSSKDQAVIKQCAKESALYERELWAEREKLSEERVKAVGSEIIKLSAKEKAEFQKAVSPVYEKFCAEFMDIVDAIIAAGK